MSLDPITGLAIINTVKSLPGPARVAIEKLSGGIAQLYEPTHIRRVAKAQADAALIKAIGEQDVAALSAAAENRESYRKIRQELNLKLISDRAADLFDEAPLPPTAATPADEWIDEFTDQSKDASTEELRELWARLFVAETKQAGAVPRRILRTVRDLDASLAKSFTALLALSITAPDGRILVYSFKGWLDNLAFTNRDLRELEDVGLVESPQGSKWSLDGGAYRLSQGRVLRLTFEENKSLSINRIQLTSAGIALAAVAERGVNEQYVSNLRAAAEKAGAKTEYLLVESPRTLGCSPFRSISRKGGPAHPRFFQGRHAARR
jgi:hypothetical protein